ncbi:MAG: peptidylprolyl isomerase [Methanomicrobiales archaeon]|nr:peptidylprolyl isomerase [Methanomicrobiales archaeon]
MAIQKGDFVRLSFTGSVNGDVFDTTDVEKAKEEGIFDAEKPYGPIVVRVGSMHVIPGLDEALEGKEVGTEDEIEIPPEKGYGPHENELVRSTTTKEFKEKPHLGMRVSSEGREGVVVNVIGKRVLIDFNHPLAGKTLTYTYRIEGTVEDAEGKAKALIWLFSGREMETALADGVLTVMLPPGITYDRRWLMGRGMIVHQIFEYIDGIQEIVLKETFTRPAKPEDIDAEAVDESPEA